MNKLEGKVVLVTGANGFIGTHLAERLSAIVGVKLLLLSRQEKHSTLPDVVWLQGALEQLTAEYWRARGVTHIDYIFHLGAYTPKNGAEGNRIDSAVDDNIAGTRVLLQGLPNKPEKFVFSSTLDVYAPTVGSEVLTEGSRVAPGTLYGASKLFCESLVATWAKERDCNYAILRYGHIYGPGEEQYQKLIPVVIRNLLSDQAPVVHGDGSALRDYLFVGDAVEATIRAATVEGDVGPVNVVRGESIKMKEIVQLLIRLVGSTQEIKFLSDKPNGNSLRFDNSLMTKLLGNWAMTSLDRGLAAEVEAFRRVGNERK